MNAQRDTIRDLGLQGPLVRGAAEDDVEVRGQLADLRALDRLEVGHQQLAVDQAAAAADDAVDLVAGVAGDVDLGGEQLAVPLLHLEVDVRGGPAGVRDRLDRAEVVLARSSRW